MAVASVHHLFCVLWHLYRLESWSQSQSWYSALSVGGLSETHHFRGNGAGSVKRVAEIAVL